jgi:ketosteroid isomerase-like protein
METAIETDAPTTLGHLRQAISRRDLDALATCFAPDYDSTFPAHPDRGFSGHEQMRRNWAQIFAAVPDIEAWLLRWAAVGDTLWAEWDWHGTRADGAPFAMRGVTIQGVSSGRIIWARLYMEPVQQGAGPDAAVRQTLTGGAGA